MIAIVCDTPYQLTSALLVYDKIGNKEPIVFFVNRYLYFKEQDFNYKDSHPLVHKILYYGRKHMSPRLLFCGLMNPNSMLKTIDGYDKQMKFSAIISSRTTYMATYLYKQNRKHNNNLPVYLIEEGIGEYTNDMIHTRFTKACATLKQKTHMDNISCAYFSAPELYPYKTAFPIKKIPSVTAESRKLIESVLDIEYFNKDGNPLADFNCIFLSEPNSCEMADVDAIKIYEDFDNKIMDTVAQTVGYDNMVIKVHPIDPFFKKEGIKTYYSKLPMEALLLTLPCDNKIFVAPASTAMITPKLLFNKEPYLVFTHKLVHDLLEGQLPSSIVLNRYYEFVDGVIEQYSEKGKCVIPNTIDELKTVLTEIQNKITSKI